MPEAVVEKIKIANRSLPAHLGLWSVRIPSRCLPDRDSIFADKDAASIRPPDPISANF